MERPALPQATRFAWPSPPGDAECCSARGWEAMHVTRGARGARKHRSARPPFVVSEISDSKAASSKPDARAKTGATAPGDAHCDRFRPERKGGRSIGYPVHQYALEPHCPL